MSITGEVQKIFNDYLYEEENPISHGMEKKNRGFEREDFFPKLHKFLTSPHGRVLFYGGKHGM